MDRISKSDIQQLAEITQAPCVSIYFPTERTGREIRQNPIRLKNLMAQAEQEMQKQKIGDDQIAKVLSPARDLVNDEEFWRYQSDGFAFFATPEMNRYFRLPTAFDELAVAGDHFHLKPLLELITVDGKFFVLALSQNQVRLLQGNRQRITELELDGVPHSLAEAMKYDDPELSLQFRQGGAEVVGSESGDTRAAIYHGHGAAKEPHKDQLLRFFQQIDRGLDNILADEKAPMVLAGVDYYFPIYREASRYDHILEDGIEGNPEHLKADELHTRAWRIVEPVFQQALARAKENYHQATAKNQASSDVKSVVHAAIGGRVGTLFLEKSKQQWGKVDNETNKVHVHQQQQTGDQDLLDYAALRTFSTDGTVYVVDPEDMPDNSPAAAIFRY